MAPTPIASLTPHNHLRGHAISSKSIQAQPHSCSQSCKKRLTLAFFVRTIFRRSLVCLSTCVFNSSAVPEGHKLATMKTVPRVSAPFGDFFVERFTRTHPQIASFIRPDQTALAANVYLFRFDERLSSDFVNINIDTVSRMISDISGKTFEEARLFFTTSAREAARFYFATRWNDTTQYVDMNTPSLIALRRLSTRHVAICDFLHEKSHGGEVDPILLDTLRETGIPIVAFVFAKYCSTCAQLRPLFESAAHQSDEDVLFVSLNGPKYPEVGKELQVAAYPAILKLTEKEGVIHFPSTREISVDNIISFAHSENFRLHDDASIHLENSGIKKLKALDHSLLSDILRKNPEQWATLLKEGGKYHLELLMNERNAVMHHKIAHAIKCEGLGYRVAPIRDHKKGEPLPLCMLLGGGMGAGKTTIMNLISRTEFWQSYGESVVMVEADAFKHDDPLFQVLQGVTPLASRIVHQDSIAAAEELFLKAVNRRRDVVFDGTLSWNEYARQTVQMLRDTNYFYKRGPGFVERENGETEELYWVRAEKRQVPALPYRIELVGVTAEAEISVMRGIVRRITTGRGVAVADQLKSHALFSKNFETYVNLVDSAYLFDTTLPSVEDIEEKKKDYTTQLIGLKPGILFKTPDDASPVEGLFFVRFKGAFSRFIRKRSLNTSATCSEELYRGPIATL